jgi:GNAT superfamily N-acetyltransferase
VPLLDSKSACHDGLVAEAALEDLNLSSQDEVRALILAGLRDHWGVVDEALNPDLDDMLESYGSGRTVVARNHHQQIVGTGTVLRRSGPVAEVLRMSVRADIRRTGVGRLILNELVATARGWGCETVILETSSNWTDVIAFYQRCGFRVTHTESGKFGSDTWFAQNLVVERRPEQNRHL